jgi:hypothetical protein
LQPKEREDALRLAEDALKNLGYNITLSHLTDISDDEPEWVTVLRAAFKDRQQAEWLLNQPDFSLVLLPETLRKDAIEALMMLEGLRPEAWLKSPFGLTAVRWAYQQTLKFMTEQVWSEIVRRWQH